MRANPPGGAAGTDGNRLPRRRRVFSAALEQAEQLFRAGEAADPGIRPILLFYGLSQATRAIAAASHDASLDGGAWWLSGGHGLTARDDRLFPADLAEVRVAPKTKSGAFQTLQTVLGSPHWTEEVAVGPLLAAIPGLPMFGHRSDWPALLLHPQIVYRIANGDPERMEGIWVKNAPTWLHARAAEVPDHYRGLAGMDLTGHGITGGKLWAVYPGGQWPENRLQPDLMPDPYWAMPHLGGVEDEQHPLVLWWAVLFALSMRARYQPQGWTQDMDPDRDRAYAVLLDQALTAAIATCPRLLEGAIRQVSGLGDEGHMTDG